MFWVVKSFPTCTHHVFLSHSGEDREDLVFPIEKSLRRLGIQSWIDRDDYPYGRTSADALRSGVLTARHVVFFITEMMLTRNTRGWCALELAYAELLQINYHRPGGAVMHAFLPLFFVDFNHPELSRSIWNMTRDRGSFFRPTIGGLTPKIWAVRQIKDFLSKQRDEAKKLRENADLDENFRSNLDADSPGLRDRATRFLPSTLRF